MGAFEGRLAIDHRAIDQLVEGAVPALSQHVIDVFTRRHLEAGMGNAEALRQLADHPVVLARFAGRLDQLRADGEILVAAGAIEVVVFEEGGGGQHHVGHLRGVGHELLVHRHEEILA